ncbi:MAG TPA: prephenate dehydratase [Candidatus Avipropionibacterium avicola]|uniref:Prephenate dehydratase n=1 Tax=Candidatus Avipropionibacterium avicola TaxID=2840701 RepID=A0A9D1GUW8_9ACTN|nr:prephenate dehydratase [Candidatus Avipropionibacterium avicola]
MGGCIGRSVFPWSTNVERAAYGVNGPSHYSDRVTSSAADDRTTTRRTGPAGQRFGFLGPEGTFTHQALVKIGHGGEATPYPDVLTTIDAVVEGQVEAALVPIENSIEGGVSATLDHLAAAEGLMITAEVTLPVEFVLCARHPVPLEQVSEVVTHPVADAQVRGWLAQHLPGVAVRHAGSTAGAAAAIAADTEPGRVAVCAAVAAQLHGLAVLHDGIADNRGAETRFVVVRRHDTAVPEPTGADKTTLVLYQRDDRSGALLEILDQFASRGINLTRIESRPTKTALGNYCFSVDAEGHLLDERMGEALTGLHRICKRVRFLGSYPRADRRPNEVAEHNANADFAEARDWLQRLRDNA